MDLSAIPYKTVGAALAAAATAWNRVSAWRRRRRAAASDSARRALKNAEQLEAYARDVWDLIVANDYGYQVGASARPGHQYEFALPALAGDVATGDGAPDVRLEARWRDLQQMIGEVKHHVDETYYSDYGGPEEALAVLERRAYQVADRAFALARQYRRQFGLPHRQPGQRERRREQHIHDEAIARDGRPFVLNLPALVRYALAVRRCAPATPRRVYRSRWTTLKRALRRVFTASRPEP